MYNDVSLNIKTTNDIAKGAYGLKTPPDAPITPQPTAPKPTTPPNQPTPVKNNPSNGDKK